MDFFWSNQGLTYEVLLTTITLVGGQNNEDCLRVFQRTPDTLP